jgi:hypothetical protein
MSIKRFYFASLGALSLTLLAFCTISAVAKPPVRLWSVDLGADSDFRKRLNVQEVLLNRPSINFLSNSTIICDFYDGETIGFNPSLTLHGYHVLEVNASTGRFERKLSFESADDNSRALPVADGGFVVLAGGSLKKYNSEFEPRESYPTPIESINQRPDLWRVDVAPGASEILLYHHGVGEQGELTWLRTIDLSIMDSVLAKPVGGIHASDRAGIFSGVGNRLLISKDKTSVLCKLCNAYFLTDDLILIDRGKEYSIESITGEKRWHGRLGIGGEDFSRAANATRFAYVTGHYAGSGFPRQTHSELITGKIIVLDWSTNKRVTEIDFNEPSGNPSAGMTQSALALSADGKYLAVLLHHTLSLYRLP